MTGLDSKVAEAIDRLDFIHQSYMDVVGESGDVGVFNSYVWLRDHLAAYEGTDRA